MGETLDAAPHAGLGPAGSNYQARLNPTRRAVNEMSAGNAAAHSPPRGLNDPASICCYTVRSADKYPPLALRQADEVRNDFAAILDDLDFIKGQLARKPSRAWTSLLLLIGFGSVWALIAAIELMLARCARRLGVAGRRCVALPAEEPASRFRALKPSVPSAMAAVSWIQFGDGSGHGGLWLATSEHCCFCSLISRGGRLGVRPGRHATG